jgi:hypothetical protein
MQQYKARRSRRLHHDLTAFYFNSKGTTMFYAWATGSMPAHAVGKHALQSRSPASAALSSTGTPTLVLQQGEGAGGRPGPIVIGRFPVRPVRLALRHGAGLVPICSHTASTMTKNEDEKKNEDDFASCVYFLSGPRADRRPRPSRSTTSACRATTTRRTTSCGACRVVPLDNN